MRSKTLARAAFRDLSTAEIPKRRISPWRLMLAGAVLVALAAGAASAGNAITNITVADKTDRVVVTVQGDCALSFVPIVSTAGKYVGFQFPRPLAVKGRVVGIHSGGIYSVRYSSFRPSPPLSRIVVNTASRLSYATHWSADKKRVELHVMKAGVKAPAKPAPDAPKPAVSADPEPPPASASAAAPKEEAPALPEVSTPADTAQPTDARPEPKPAAERRSAYKAIAEKSRLPRTAVEPPAPEPVAQSPAEPVVSSPAPEPAKVAPVVKTAKAPEARPEAKPAAERRSAYKAIAEKSRLPRVASEEPAVLAAAPTTTSGPAPEPEIRVMGMTETSAAPGGGAVPAEPKPPAAVDVPAEPEPRVAADVPAESKPPVAVDAPAEPKSPRAEARPFLRPRVVLPVPDRSRPAAERKVSVNFLGADINDVLKALSVQSGVNIVAGKDVTGSVTVSLSNVGLEEALDYVARLSGYTYTKDGDTYLVSTKDALRALTSGSGPDSKTELIKLSYAKADDVIALLKGRYPDVLVSKVGVEPPAKGAAESKSQTPVGLKNNLLVLVGPEASVKEARALAEQFEDMLRVQAIESSRSIYRVKYANPAQLAQAVMALVPGVEVVFAPTSDFELVKFKSAKATAGQAPQVERDFNNSGGASGSGSGKGPGSPAGADNSGTSGDKPASVTNARTLVIVGDEQSVAKALEVAAQLDLKAPQIKIDAKISSISESGEKKLGFTWKWGDYGAVEGFTDFDKSTDTAPGVENKQNVKVPHDRMYRTPWSFSAALDALVTSGDAQVLATPSIVCLERNPGVFFVGDEVTYVQRVETTPTGQNILTDTKRVGVQMVVVGEINDDGYVTLYLHPEVSTLKLTVEQGVTLPIVSSRFTDHVVRVKNGETIVIGGLIRNDEIEEMSKVPILGDLPLLGSLFRHKHTTTDHTEVVMFITASILQD